eukprot:Gregarina_sp_Poly_1__8261@NODE_481_length_8028_cov_336_122975_g389_i0_p3_GENE_NODE_481_length_8028_cov_336_122975_g389_i0NODE_481_length_8028_cov_336_122975_g389_i0_p3_ORF_typecomplete_len268_score28_29CDC73_C/PF05179_14/2_6e10Tugs/PF17840_1/0_22_NODE_481_length_8028_cov_336_122975_g389_i032184021
MVTDDLGFGTFLNPKNLLYLSGTFDNDTSRLDGLREPSNGNAGQSVCDEIDSIVVEFGRVETADDKNAPDSDGTGSIQRDRPKASLKSYFSLNALIPTVLFPDENIQPPFKSLADLQHFVVTQSLSAAPLNVPRGTSFIHDISIANNPSSLITVKFIDMSRIHHFSGKDWHSVIGVFVTGYKSILSKLPFDSYEELAKCFHIFYSQWDDDIPIPSFLHRVPFTSLRFSQGSRHNDRILWLNMVNQFVRRLQRPYDFEPLRQALKMNE